MRIDVQIADDSMKANLVVKVEKGESIKEIQNKALFDALSKNGITTGIDKTALKQISMEKIVNKAICVAKGIPPGTGDNAKVEILKKPKGKKDLKAPQTSDGSVDYYAQREGFLVYVRKGEALATKYPPTRGSPGKNVLGVDIPGRMGNEISLELFAGINTSIVKSKILAAIDGIVLIEGRRISVVNKYKINDNVGINTGSINLPLDLDFKLEVNGDVQSGYHVICPNLYVTGCIEDAVVTARNLEVKQGIVGVSEQKVTAENIKVGYINGSRTVETKTLTVLKEISNGANVISNAVKVYAIQSSTVLAIDAIWTDYVNGNNTVTVGVDYHAKQQFDELSKKILQLEDPIEDLKKQDLLNAKRMKKLAELARINRQHPLLQKELPKIREAKNRLDKFLNIRMELIKKKEKITEKMYVKREPILLVQSGFSKDSSSGVAVEPNTLITIRDRILRITDTSRGGLFTYSPTGINHSIQFNIKAIQDQFDKYFEASRKG